MSVAFCPQYTNGGMPANPRPKIDPEQVRACGCVRTLGFTAEVGLTRSETASREIHWIVEDTTDTLPPGSRVRCDAVFRLFAMKSLEACTLHDAAYGSIFFVGFRRTLVLLRFPQIPRPIVGGDPVTYRTCTPPSVTMPPAPTSNYVALDEVGLRVYLCASRRVGCSVRACVFGAFVLACCWLTSMSK